MDIFDRALKGWQDVFYPSGGSGVLPISGGATFKKTPLRAQPADSVADYFPNKKPRIPTEPPAGFDVEDMMDTEVDEMFDEGHSAAPVITETKKPNKKKKGHSSFTMGFYKGPFRRLRNKRKRDPFRTLGSTVKVELGATATGADVAEVGHSVCVPQLMLQSAGRALFRRLWEKFGDVISDWAAVSIHDPAKVQFRISYRADITTGAITNTAYVFFTTATTYAACADKLMNAILVLVTTTNDHLILESVDFRDADGNDMLQKINLREATLTLAVNSILVLQNITPSHTIGDDDHTQITDIRANPIIGRCWQTNSNSFIPIGGSTDGFTSGKAAIADSRNGLVGNTLTGALPHPKAPNFYMNCKRSGQVHLQPGHIKKSTLNCYKRLRWNSFMRLMKRWTATNTLVTGLYTNAYVNSGPSRIFHFEHQLKNTNDPPISVGWEINLFCKSYLTHRVSREALRIEE